jgi:enediyne polyketide synthase
MTAIGIVGMACRYPGASSCRELWDNVLSQRREFRRIPPERLRLEDYEAPAAGAESIYCTRAALLEDYEFDRTRFQVSGEMFRSADLVHWLTLDVAASALAEAGLDKLGPAERARTGVYIGNTLTGEMSRAQTLRLRWPYVRRTLDSIFRDRFGNDAAYDELVAEFERRYKAPFAPTTEESLAGGLSNTIAGRICNYFDFHGGGYTLDGACASSLLAITTACSALASRDVDIAVAGGVDLSMDPFELAGFARLGALAREKMRIYDAASNGFWPGEGCGIVVLMRIEDALEQRLAAHAVIRGWGVSSDGTGSITRPEPAGQMLALERAYARAEYGIESVEYFEGHGTGTTVGDAAELRALSSARGRAQRDGHPAAIGSVKANIGHTKAAAGVAGLIKATLAVKHQILPPTTGCDEPHEELRGPHPALRVLRQGEIWPGSAPLRAGVSAMGFGGINTHVTLEGNGSSRRRELGAADKLRLRSAQDAELFVFAATSHEDLRTQVDALRVVAAGLSESEITDLSVMLARRVAGERGEGRTVRAAVVADDAPMLADRLALLLQWLGTGISSRIDGESGVFLGSGTGATRIGFLFSGQASPVHFDSGIWARRFPSVASLYDRSPVPAGPPASTAVAQPAVVAASLAALRVLNEIGIEACIAVGHSLGELTALHWAGALEEDALLRIVHARGSAMEQQGDAGGAMVSLRVDADSVRAILNGDGVAVAAFNSPLQTVLSGDSRAIARVIERAESQNIASRALPVSRAFHSPLVERSVPLVAECLRGEQIHAINRHVVSTVTGSPLPRDCDVYALLCRQILAPVRFREAVETASKDLDLWIEVGPGSVLAGLATECAGVPAIATQASGESLCGLLLATGAAFASGASIDLSALCETRFARPFDPLRRRQFLKNPCESAPVGWSDPAPRRGTAEAQPNDSLTAAEMDGAPARCTLDVLRRLVASRTELPLDRVPDGCRLLADLHLNSITVSQIIVEAAQRLCIAAPVAPTDYSTVTLRDAADALDEIRLRGGESASAAGAPAGVDTWVRCFTAEWIEAERQRTAIRTTGSRWGVVARSRDDFAARVAHSLEESSPDNGTLVCLPPGAGEECVDLLLEAAHAALEAPQSRLVVVQRDGGASAFFRSLYLELSPSSLCIVNLADDDERSAGRVAEEASTAHGFVEVSYGPDGSRRERRIRLFSEGEVPGSGAPLDAGDVLVVSGGGNGIGMECALAMGVRYGVKIALLGRSDPLRDAELAQRLERFKAAGTFFRYYQADVTDSAAVEAACRAIESDLGAATALLHCGGYNVPQPLRTLDAASFANTLAPKLAGLRNLLGALHPDRLRLLVTFGSLIAQTGLPGEADYAAANEWMGRIALKWAAGDTGRRLVHLDWSVWAGTGMGQRLGAIDSLMRQGIASIPLDEGVKKLLSILESGASGLLMVASRFGTPATMIPASRELPLRRFLEEPLVHYPGIELVADFELSETSDEYLAEHIFGGERIFPAALGLEAMAQAAAALMDRPTHPAFEDIRMLRPIVVPGRGGALRVRAAALRRESGAVEVVLRSAATNFQSDHFRAICRFDQDASENLQAGANRRDAPRIVIDPQAELYGSLLFQAGRFRRVRGYRHLRAKECVAEIGSVSEKWFAHHLPATLLLGDPGARDALMHCIQACIPHLVLLPAGVDRIVIRGAWPDTVSVHAVERSHSGKEFVYDAEVQDTNGMAIERWEGLRLLAVAPAPARLAWPAALLATYLERRLEELLPHTGILLTIENGARAREERVRLTLGRLIPDGVSLLRRADGRPELAGSSMRISFSHTGSLTLCACSEDEIGCDLQQVTPQPAPVWRSLLGQESPGIDRMQLAETIMREAGESLDTAATRIWVVQEALKKAGAFANQPLLAEDTHPDGWVTFRSGQFAGATFAAGRVAADELIFGVAVRREHEELRVPPCSGL